MLDVLLEILRTPLDHPFLLAELAVLLFILWGGCSQGGLPLLFWHEDATEQAIAGFACTVFVGELGFLAHLVSRRPDDPAGYTLGAWGLAWFAGVGGRALQLWSRRRAAGRGESVPGLTPRAWTGGHHGMSAAHLSPAPFLRGAVLGAAVIAAIAGLEAHLPGREAFSADAGAFLILGLLALTSLVLRRLSPRVATPAAGTAVLLGTAAAIYGLVAAGPAPPLLLILLAGLLLFRAGQRSTRLSVPGITSPDSPPGGGLGRAGTPEAAASEAVASQAAPSQAAAPHEHAAPGKPPLDMLGRPKLGAAAPGRAVRRPLILVCTSGGGLRAAAWTAAILGRLHDRNGAPPRFHLIAGASGGMVGAAAYVGWLLNGRGVHPFPWRALATAVGADSLSWVSHRLIFNDLPHAFLARANGADRGRALEESWRANLQGTFDLTFGDLAGPEGRGEVPALVFAPMLVEDGRRLLISNLDLSELTASRVHWIVPGDPRGDVASVGAHQLASLLSPEAWKALPISTAARLSAAFPWVSPAPVVRLRPRRRAVDAGYFDNYGLDLLSSWLRECFEHHRSWIEAHVARVLVIQIRDNVSELGLAEDRRRAPGREASTALARGLEGLTGPVEGVLSARESGMVFRNDAHLETVTWMYEHAFGAKEPQFLRTTIFEFKGEASLSWYLTRHELGQICDQAESPGITAKCDDVRRWIAG